MPLPPSIVRIILFIITITTISHSQWTASSISPASSSSSSPSSNLLRLHRRLYSQPAHDKSLYAILGVPTNATAVIIDKAYRKRQLEFHPDKRQQYRRQRHDDDDDDDDDADALQKIREAYEILKDDDKRLLYHRFGIIDVTDAVGILTGNDETRRWGSLSSSSSSTTRTEKDIMLENRCKLLRLMGYSATTTSTAYHPPPPPPPPPSSSPPLSNSRIMSIAADLTERLRPLIEGTLTPDQLAHLVHTDCNHLKKLPLGAQILRCVGRAYRHAGQSYLRRQHRLIATPTRTTTASSKMAGAREDWRERWRRGKGFLTAVMAGGRYIVTDKMVKRRFDNDKKKKKTTGEELSPSSMIGYHFHDVDDDDDDDSGSDSSSHPMIAPPPSCDDIRQSREEKTQTAVVTALQIEALWKVTKIELDRVVTEACRLILSRDYFFYGMTTTTTREEEGRRRRRRRRDEEEDDGWVVGETGRVIESDVACLRVAAALVLLGDIFVRCSKEGTSWRES